jgi:hypothetical protein
MYEDLQIAAGLFVDGAHFLDRQLARQRDAIRTQIAREQDALGIRDTHLRAGVQFQTGRDRTGKPEDADILDDEGVNATFCRGCNNPRGFGQLVLENKRVERQIAAHTPALKRFHYFGQFFQQKTNFGAG